MKKVQFENISFTLYDDITQFPAQRFAIFQSKMSFTRCLKKSPSQFVAEIAEAVNHEDKEQAKLALNNLAQALAFIDFRFNISAFCFSICIKDNFDFTADGLSELMKNGLGDLPQALIDSTIQQIDESTRQQIKLKFRELQNTKREWDYFNTVKTLGMEYLDSVLLPEDNSHTLMRLAKTIFELTKSESAQISDHKNIANLVEKEYANIFLSIDKDVKAMTVNEMLLYLSVMKDQYEKSQTKKH